MTLWWQYGILGLGAGAAYVLLAQGILLIYRGSGVVNFAHGGFAMLGAYIYNVELRGNHGLGVLPAMLISVAVIGLLAGLVHPLIMRPLRSAAPLTRVIATLGVLLVLQAVATLRWGSASESVLPVLPQNPIHITSRIVLSEDRLIIVIIAIGVTAGRTRSASTRRPGWPSGRPRKTSGRRPRSPGHPTRWRLPPGPLAGRWQRSPGS
jgi:branched-subunit amino acid ABC-type transport system permease component